MQATLSVKPVPETGENTCAHRAHCSSLFPSVHSVHRCAPPCSLMEKGGAGPLPGGRDSEDPAVAGEGPTSNASESVQRPGPRGSDPEGVEEGAKGSREGLGG